MRMLVQNVINVGKLHEALVTISSSIGISLCGYNSVSGVLKTIRKTCPCNVYPLEPHFYIVKLGFAEVYLFFLFLLQNIDCGYSLEPPR